LGRPSGAAVGKLYQVDLATGASSSQAFDWSGFIGGVTTDGLIVGADSASGAWYVAVIDPLTAAVTKKGTFSGIDGVSSVVYDSTLNVAPTVGTDARGTAYLYSVDLTTGVGTQVPTNGNYILAKQ
jgi:hypothetical protein